MFPKAPHVKIKEGTPRSFGYLFIRRDARGNDVWETPLGDIVCLPRGTLLVRRLVPFPLRPSAEAT